MAVISTEVNAVIASKTESFYAETRTLWEPLLQRPLTNEECEALIVRFTDFALFIREIVLKGNIQPADKGEIATEVDTKKNSKGD
jgi:hypothetical protein